jgi:hypothetical protein
MVVYIALFAIGGPKFYEPIPASEWHTPNKAALTLSFLSLQAEGAASWVTVSADYVRLVCSSYPVSLRKLIDYCSTSTSQKNSRAGESF